MPVNRLSQLSKSGVLSLFFTAGYPRLNDTRAILADVQTAGVDMVEIGIPFSDPVADGPTIQASSEVALTNGMTVETLFQQLEGMRPEISIPVLLMGYLNPMLQFGVEKFLARSREVGVDALIIPDLPFDEYQRVYAALYQEYGIKPVFLVTRRTPEKRIREFDAVSPAFIYVVSSEATTGGKATVDSDRERFFARLESLKLQSKLIVGFGVSDKESFDAVTKHTQGAIVGSAFLRALDAIKGGKDSNRSDAPALTSTIQSFVDTLRGK